ncbi:MAG: DUF475 domain-containing protein [Cyanobacteria bacterium P01_D01_bin.123]
MDSIELTVLSDILRSLEWSDLLVVAALVVLEAALSADNAVALAALVKHLPEQRQREQALRWGILGAYGFRILIILTATWAIAFWPAKLAGALYLLWLTVQHFRDKADPEVERVPNTANFWQTLILVELTDIAFSFDSIAASIAFSSKTWVIILGGVMGITLMRFMAGFFVRWLDEFGRLEDAAYLMIALVGTRMALELLVGQAIVQEWAVMSMVGVLFAWGFSKRSMKADDSLTFPLESMTESAIDGAELVETADTAA